MYIGGPEARAAMRLVLRHWASKPLPIDPAAIAIAEGVRVRPYAFFERGDGTSGYYNPDENGRPTIAYNDGESKLRQRFTIAHELGHHMLAHGARPRDSVTAFSLENYDPVEAAANRFAAALLMPDPVVRNLVTQRGVNTIEALAERMQVSQVAMKYRLQNLGLV